MSIFCPIDKKDDAIQKVSAVVASGQSSGRFSGPTGGVVSHDGKIGYAGGYTTLSGSSTSELAKLLAPPPEPKMQGGLGLWWIPIGIFIGGFIIGIPMQFIFGVIGILLMIPLMLTGYAQPKDITWEVGIYICGGILALMVSIVIWILLLRIWKSFQRKDKALKKENEEKYLFEKLKWEKAIQKWQRSYYCHKHDIVFDPNCTDYCDPRSLMEFLYRN